MSDKKNAEKSKQLGMSFSTASHHLRKSLMFQLVQQCERDVCHRCGEQIDSADNMSIEHINPWLHSDNPKELFFDLDNIAFSHRSCNYGETTRKVFVGDSGFKGVSTTDVCKSRPWRATISLNINGKNTMKFIGHFATAEEAGKAYDEKAIEMFGENAVTNKSLGLL